MAAERLRVYAELPGRVWASALGNRVPEELGYTIEEHREQLAEGVTSLLALR